MATTNRTSTRYTDAIWRALLASLLLVSACASPGSQPGPSEASDSAQASVYEQRTDQLAQFFPATDRGSLEAVVSADRCPRGPRLEEPVLIGEVLSNVSEQGGFVIVSDAELQAALQGAQPSGLEPDLKSVQIGSDVAILIDDAISGAQALTGRANSWFVGVGPNVDSALAAIFDSGQIAFVNNCLFGLRTLPIAELAAARAVTPASLLEALAAGDGQEIIDQLSASDQSADSSPQWDDLPPDQRSLETVLSIPDQALEGLEPYTVHLSIPQTWQQNPGVVCVFGGAAWSSCSDVAIFGGSSMVPMRGLALPDGDVIVGLFTGEEPSFDSGPIVALNVSQTDAGYMLEGTTERAYNVAVESGQLTLSNATAQNTSASALPPDHPTVDNTVTDPSRPGQATPTPLSEPVTPTQTASPDPSATD